MVVDMYSKIDLHIHSAASSNKDGGLVAENTHDNTRILLERLNENEVSLFSITDHNKFDYDLYQKLRSELDDYENVYEVLPGIEVDVMLNDKVHVICIFDNKKSVTSLKEIERVFCDLNITDYIEPSEFETAIKKINLNVVFIVHQKSDPNSLEYTSDNDLSNSGLEMFNKLLKVGYYDAVEFMQERVSAMLKVYSNEQEIGNLVGLTGSDCHQWNVYPYYSKQQPGQYSPTFIKSMPTFKGLVMAITDNRRINTSEPEHRTPYINNLQFKLGNKAVTVPLSKGINAIIGDNTTGKSLLLNTLMNDIPSDYKDNYLNFLSENEIEILTILEDEEKKRIEYNSQGSIRKMFEKGGSNIYDKYKHLFEEVDFTSMDIVINNEVINLFEMLEFNDKFHNAYQKLDQNIAIPCKTEKTFNLSITGSIGLKNTNYTKITSELKKIVSSIDNLIKIDYFSEKDQLLDMKKEVNRLKSIYDRLSLMQSYENKIINTFKRVKESFNSSHITSENTTDSEAILGEFKSKMDEYINDIKTYHQLTLKTIKKPLSETHKIEIEPKFVPYGDYKFVTFPEFKKFDNTKIIEILLSPFASSRLNDIDTLLGLRLSKLKSFFDENVSEDIKKQDNKQRYISQMTQKINKEYKKTHKKIVKHDSPIEETNSAGKNALYYIDIVGNESNKKVFIVDQPEDDVSQNKISSDLSESLKKMSRYKQILIVTHNPQLVVNLDVDNVICFENDGNFEIKFGPLEFEGPYNILEIVAKVLDGGADVIQKRWKRYEKSN
jgi:predicted ATP-dependent endonuclease of OLD family